MFAGHEVEDDDDNLFGDDPLDEESGVEMSNFLDSEPAVAAKVTTYRFGGSPEKRKKAALYAVAIGALVLVVCASFILGRMSVSASKSSSSVKSDVRSTLPKPPPFSLPSEAKTERFRAGPFTIGAAEISQNFTMGVPRPEGDIAIHKFAFHVEDSFGRNIPLEHIYNHHIFWFDERILCSDTMMSLYEGFIAAFGAEGEFSPVAFPYPYATTSLADKEWGLFYHFIDLWGRPATTNTTFYIVYDVTYSPLTEEHRQIYFQLGGVIFTDGPDSRNISVEVAIPGDGSSPESTYLLEGEFNWEDEDATIVATAGHIHIGSLNSTLYDGSGAIISQSKATYDEFGFVVALDIEYPFYNVSTGDAMKLRCLYDNTYHYEGVMCLQIFYIYSPEKIAKAKAKSQECSLTDSSLNSEEEDEITEEVDDPQQEKQDQAKMHRRTRRDSSLLHPKLSTLNSLNKISSHFSALVNTLD